MPRRLALSLLIAWLAWIPTVSAQGPNPPGPPGPGYSGMAPDGQYAGGPAPVYDRQVPTLAEQFHPMSRQAYYDLDSAFELALIETFSQTWFRADYLFMNLRGPNGNFLGATPLAPPPLTFDPTAFYAVDRIGARFGVEGRLISLQNSNNQDGNGLRITMGVPTQMFTFEASAFALAQLKEDLQFPTFPNPNNLGFTVIPSIPLTRNGLLSRFDFILFDGGMDVAVRSNLQGTDAKLVFGAFTPNVGIEVAPLVGFNYIHYSNELTIRGSDAGTATTHVINSRANNNIFGPEVGLRFEARSRWLTLGFEPKFTFGINRMYNRVATQQIFTPAEADRLIKDGLTRFSPVIDLGANARIRMAENVHLTLGYQFMATSNVSLAEQNIVWDSSSILTDPPRIGLQQNRHTFWTQAINVGLQWQF